uniref:Transmembrane protein 183 n=1 Tax=Lygus hesperus TaxID=30085 RepID=A0A0A9ZIM8_LYGHE
MGHKKVRNHSQKKRTKADTIGDVALADFADANIPRSSGRVRKSRSNLPLSAPIEDGEEDVDINTVLAQKVDALSTETESSGVIVEENSIDAWLLLPDELWVLLSEYMRPQDVLNFSLICKSSYRIVNSPLFWIKLYKRYYSSKVYVPTFLKKHCLERHLGLKAKVIRSLFYTYPPYHESLRRPNNLLESLIGHRCELMWVQRACDKEITNNSLLRRSERWIYSFKLSSKPDESRHYQQTKRKTKQDIINHNPDDTCRLLEVFCKEYVDPKCVIGMKLRKASIEDRCVQLKFSSAPLSRFGTDFGAIDIYLHAIQPPSIYAWWHPHFYNQRY